MMKAVLKEEYFLKVLRIFYQLFLEIIVLDLYRNILYYK
jgi:hypothetical protein